MFADFNRWDPLELPRRRSLPFHCVYWLNQFQLEVVQKFLAGDAWIDASATVWVESKVGRAHVSRSFRLATPHKR